MASVKHTWEAAAGFGAGTGYFADVSAQLAAGGVELWKGAQACLCRTLQSRMAAAGIEDFAGQFDVITTVSPGHLDPQRNGKPLRIERVLIR